jgi:hypothetical protein
MASLGWLLLRSGVRPSRLSYPCQQAALSTSALLLGGPLIAAIIVLRRRAAHGVRVGVEVAVVALCVLTALGSWGHVSPARADSLLLQPPADHRSRIFHVTDCPAGLDGDRFRGLDNLLVLMGRHGFKFYRSPASSRLAGPDGMIARSDVVLIKINYQWDQRGGTNTDLLHGLIRAIVDHPDGFSGEIVVCENGQFASLASFDRSRNNSSDYGRSPFDVVSRFRDSDHAVSLFDWTDIRFNEVEEYSAGDDRDGYVVYQYESEIHGRVSYPKFETEFGTRISLRDGIWLASRQSYDRDSLKFINVPVLKSHHSTYGVTACVKNYMGVVTDSLGTNSHNAIRYGLLGALLAEIGPADLNILDCIWVNADPRSGPRTSYSVATRRDELIASIDPIAADIWAAQHILIPSFIANGHQAPWPYPSADPDDPDSAFRTYLDNSMRQLLSAGYPVTNDLEQIEAHTLNETASASAPRRTSGRKTP